MMGLIFSIATIAGGILLGITALDKLDGESDFFNNIAKKLMPFTVLIGGACLVLGILLLFKHILYSATAIAAGLLLLTHVLSQIPSIGDSLVKASKSLMPFKVIIGIGLLILAILNIF
jgi:cadmium resistance protein CadD (predicted permease)